MKRRLWLLILAGCSSTGGAASGPQGAILATGLPGRPHQALCDSAGRWGIDEVSIDHWLFDPDAKKERDASNGGAKSSIFRDSLPFPQFSWATGDFEVTQLIYPVGDGFMTRYHVMNHGSDARSVRLLVGGRDGAASKAAALASSMPPAEKTASHLAFDLKIEPGTSQFVVLSTPEAAGKDPNDALDEAAAAWEKILATPIVIPEPEGQTAYALALAGRALGRPGAAEAVRTLEERFVKREGDALRLLGDLPGEWLLETIDVKGLKTDFGPLTFRHVGFYNSRTLDIAPGCSPPGGFLLPADPRQKATVDGKEVASKNGVLAIPAGARKVELARKF